MLRSTVFYHFANYKLQIMLHIPVVLGFTMLNLPLLKNAVFAVFLFPFIVDSNINFAEYRGYISRGNHILKYELALICPTDTEVFCR